VSGEDEGEEEMESTFNLGLTEKQRRDREGVVLPYFDALVDVGGGEGGRILYDMGREDDFDEEDDEI
jgi:elongator complex protein 5